MTVRAVTVITFYEKHVCIKGAGRFRYQQQQNGVVDNVITRQDIVQQQKYCFGGQ